MKQNIIQLSEARLQHIIVENIMEVLNEEFENMPMDGDILEIADEWWHSLDAHSKTEVMQGDDDSSYSAWMDGLNEWYGYDGAENLSDEEIEEYNDECWDYMPKSDKISMYQQDKDYYGAELNEGIRNKVGKWMVKNGSKLAQKAGKSAKDIRLGRNISSAFGRAAGKAGEKEAKMAPKFLKGTRMGANIAAGREGRNFTKIYQKMMKGDKVALRAFFKPEELSKLDAKTLKTIQNTNIVRTIGKDGKEVIKAFDAAGKEIKLSKANMAVVKNTILGSHGNASRMLGQRDALRLQQALTASLIGNVAFAANGIKNKQPKPQPEPVDPNPQPEPVDPQPQPEPVDPNPRPVDPQPRPEPVDPNPQPEPVDPQPQPVGPNPQPRPAMEPLARINAPMAQATTMNNGGLAGETDPVKRAQSQLADPTKQQQLKLDRQNQALIHSTANGNDTRAQRKAQQMVDTARGTTLQNQLSGRLGAAQSLQNSQTVNENEKIKNTVSLMEKMNKIRKGEILRG